MKRTIANRSNAKHLRAVEIDYDDASGIPSTDRILSGQLLAERCDALGISRADLLRELALRGVVISGPGISNWFASVVPPEHFGVLVSILYPSNPMEAKRLHLLLLRTAIPEGSLDLFDAVVDADRKLAGFRFKEAMRQRQRRAASGA